ncbi:MAG: YkgJ family cysteine cluster protein [Gemmataceae bacterium]
MSESILALPVLPQWDCHGCGFCCREYRVHVSAEERQRIDALDWSDLPSQPLFVRDGPWWSRRYRLNQQADGSCVFLSPEGRCRIHERHGPAVKPLACRVYPFVLVPTGSQWRVGLRYSCPSAADEQGRPLSVHADELTHYAHQLQEQNPDIDAPPLQGRQRVAWADLLLFVAAIDGLLRQSRLPLERRWRLILALASQCRRARFEKISGPRLRDFLELLTAAVPAEVPPWSLTVSTPTPLGRLLFRQLLAIYSRQDHGPDQGLAARGRLALFHAALRFARGRGPVPRLHAQLPDITFEHMEQPVEPWPVEVEQRLERYYRVKVQSLQFCGPIHYGWSFWDGLEALALTLPAIGWLSRAWPKVPRREAVTRALRIVDNNFGFNPLLGGRRQRLSLAILRYRDELTRLVGYYGR